MQRCEGFASYCRMIHGPCTIENGCVVGIGSNVLHRSKLGEGSVLAAGAVLLGKEIPPRTLAVGIPASIKKEGIYKGKLEGTKISKLYAKKGQTFKQFFDQNSS
jgi:carbonic anhydrase/acetyltransferase-like protein (isoleucine patch superfamily)